MKTFFWLLGCWIPIITLASPAQLWVLDNPYLDAYVKIDQPIKANCDITVTLEQLIPNTAIQVFIYNCNRPASQDLLRLNSPQRCSFYPNAAPLRISMDNPAEQIIRAIGSVQKTCH